MNGTLASEIRARTMQGLHDLPWSSERLLKFCVCRHHTLVRTHGGWIGETVATLPCTYSTMYDELVEGLT